MVGKNRKRREGADPRACSDEDCHLKPGGEGRFGKSRKVRGVGSQGINHLLVHVGSMNEGGTCDQTWRVKCTYGNVYGRMGIGSRREAQQPTRRRRVSPPTRGSATARLAQVLGNVLANESKEGTSPILFDSSPRNAFRHHRGVDSRARSDAECEVSPGEAPTPTPISTPARRIPAATTTGRRTLPAEHSVTQRTLRWRHGPHARHAQMDVRAVRESMVGRAPPCPLSIVPSALLPHCLPILLNRFSALWAATAVLRALCAVCVPHGVAWRGG